MVGICTLCFPPPFICSAPLPPSCLLHASVESPSCELHPSQSCFIQPLFVVFQPRGATRCAASGLTSNSQLPQETPCLWMPHTASHTMDYVNRFQIFKGQVCNIWIEFWRRTSRGNTSECSIFHPTNICFWACQWTAVGNALKPLYILTQKQSLKIQIVLSDNKIFHTRLPKKYGGAYV